MGASGAGKTTLLDVVAGRKTTGRIDGRVAINGVVMEPRQFARMVGYVEQFGVHMPSSTVRESLSFSAFTRTSGDDATRDAYLAHVEHLLELHTIPDKLCSQLSVEEDTHIRPTTTSAPPHPLILPRSSPLRTSA